MIKKILCLLLSALLLVGTLSLSAMAAGQAPQIILQPQNYQYPNYSTAIYTVKASGNNLSATWYLQWQGNTYNLSDNQNGMEPWEAYAGETYGPSQPDGNTFIWFFTGIEEELNGAEIWCVIEDGHYDVTSQRAQVMVGGSGMPAEILQVPAQCKVHRGEEALIRCVASAPVDTQLSYIWYETATGKLQDIQAVNRGTETSDFLICDTTQTGTRYYLCMVQTSQGGIAYSSVIPVTVEESAPAEDTKILTDQLPEAVVGESYSTQLRCNDAKATFSISYNPGKANDFDKTGLTLSADGKLTGRPKAAGSFQFCVVHCHMNGHSFCHIHLCF